MSTSIALLPLILFLILLVAGTSLVVWGLRSKYRGSVPHCAGCGYNLTGLAGDLCPECGNDFRQPGGMTIGTRHRRPGLVILGLAILALPGLFLLSLLSEVDWYRFMPTSLVLTDLESQDPELTGWAWTEIDRRLKAGSLSAAQQSRLVKICLAEYTSSNSSPVSDKLLKYLGQVYEAGELNEGQRFQFLDGMPVLSLQVRPRICPGESLPWSLGTGQRPFGVPLRYILRTESLRLDGAAHEGGFNEAYALGTGDGGCSLPRKLEKVPVGRHTIALRLAVKIFPGDPKSTGSTFYGSTDPKHLAWGEPIHTKTIDLTGAFEVLAEEPLGYIKHVRNSEWATWIGDCIQLSEAGFRWGKFRNAQSGQSREGWENSSTSYSSYSSNGIWRYLPTNVAADAYVRIDGVEYYAGYATGRVGQGISVQFEGITGRTKPFESFDLVLRPNERIARESLDMFEMWDGQIVKTNIPAKCEPVASNPAR